MSRSPGPRQVSVTENQTPLPNIGRPATRALEGIGVTTLEQAADHRAADLLALHGVGPRAIRILEAALAAEGRWFRS